MPRLPANDSTSQMIESPIGAVRSMSASGKKYGAQPSSPVTRTSWAVWCMGLLAIPSYLRGLTPASSLAMFLEIVSKVARIEGPVDAVDREKQINSAVLIPPHGAKISYAHFSLPFRS